MLKDLLETKKCFKLVCGAGNEDTDEVEKLVELYAKAGCRFFDLSANEQVYEAAKRGLKKANVNNAFLCISVGTKDDPHTNKAVIDYSKCISCYACDTVCPQDAIVKAQINEIRCIGCGNCAKKCSQNAISYAQKTTDLQEILPPLITKGIDCIELHAMGEDDEEVFEKWALLNKLYDGLLSICISCGKLSQEKLIRRIKTMIKDRKPYSTIIQADGYPMSGGKDDFKTTLQAIATSEVVQNENLPVYLLISGGTNSKTAQLAKMCGINANGIAVGSFARKVVKPYIKENFEKALDIAENLINSTK